MKVISGYKPLIGLNMDYRPARDSRSPGGFSSAFIGLPASYSDAIQEMGGIPLLVPPMADASDIDVILDRVDGWVLVGGADLDCRRDGWVMHNSMRCMDGTREQFDRLLVKKLAARKIPLLAIGVGMQLLNVAMGGTLHLHIPEDRPKAIAHRDSTDLSHRHALLVEGGSFMAAVYDDWREGVAEDKLMVVNSQHHQAVDDIADGFAVTARCPDGIVEAIESTSEWMAIGTQFHPERGSALDSGVFGEFIEAVRYAPLKAA